MSLSDLYAINGLTDQSVIFPGERLLIRLPDKTLTPSAPTTGTPAEAAASRDSGIGHPRIRLNAGQPHGPSCYPRPL